MAGDAYGFNAQTEKYENLLGAGDVDPTKVVWFALQNAAPVPEHFYKPIGYYHCADKVSANRDDHKILPKILHLSSAYIEFVKDNTLMDKAEYNDPLKKWAINCIY